MNSKVIAGVIIGVLVGAAGGYVIPHGASAQSKGSFAVQNSQFGGRTGTSTRGMGGAVAGQIILADRGSITIKMQDGSTKIVLMSTSTPIVKTAQGSAADLVVGTEVVAAGGANSDGSITAESIQIRPAGAAMGGNNAPMIRYQGAQ